MEAGPTTLKPTEPNAESGRGREGGGGLRVWGARGSLTGRRSSPRCSACTCRSRGCRRARRDTAGGGAGPGTPLPHVGSQPSPPGQAEWLSSRREGERGFTPGDGKA